MKQFEYDLKWNHEIDDVTGMETGMTLLKFAILAKKERVVKALVKRRIKRGLPIDDPIEVSTAIEYVLLFKYCVRVQSANRSLTLLTRFQSPTAHLVITTQNTMRSYTTNTTIVGTTCSVSSSQQISTSQWLQVMLKL